MNYAGDVLHGLAVCAGVGGLEQGLARATAWRLRCVGYVERDSAASAALVARMADARLPEAPVWDDVESFPGALYRGKVDLLSAGVPCQPFSVAGSQRGIEDERWLWPAVLRIIDAAEPWGLFIENTPQLVKLGLPYIAADLAARGFDAEWDIFTAKAVGAPHRRARVFFFAWRVSDAVGDVLRDLAERGPGPARPADARDAEPRDVGAEDLADASGFGGRGGDDEDVVGGLEFPPGPDAFERWRHVLDVAPWLAPALPDADGGRCEGEREPEQPDLFGARGRVADGLRHDGGLDGAARDDARGERRGGRGRRGTRESGLLGLADGLGAGVDVCVCSRSDRIRCAGNGVVPAQAAIAFRVLLHRALGRIE